MPRRCSRRRSQVLGLYPCRLCPAGESPSLLRLWNALLALAGFLGHGGRLALGGRSPRRNPALLAGAAAARPARAIGLMVLGGVAGGDRGSALFSLRRRRLVFMAALSAAGLVGAAVLGWTAERRNR